MPEKNISEKGRKILRAVCILPVLALLAGLVYGIILLGESRGESILGWVLIGLNVVYILTGIVLKLISHFKR